MAQIDTFHVALADRPGPGAASVAMHKNGTPVAARYAGQGARFGRHVAEIDAKRHRAVIGVRPGRDVLMPFDDFAGAGPFVVQLAAVELDVGADEVGGDVGQHRLGREPPEIGMAVDQGPEPAHMRPVRGVPGPQIERLVRCGNPPAFLEKGVGKLIEAGQPVGRDQPLGGEDARVEIMAALSLGQRARRVGQDVLGRHGANFP